MSHHDLAATRRQAVIDELSSMGWLRSVDWFEEVDSTNLAARRLLATESASLPALLIADRQTAGRGTKDHRWWSPSGCVMLTLILDDTQLPDDRDEWGRLSLVCGVAMADAVETLLPSPSNVRLKWPNDLYLGDRKAGGILIESARGGHHSERAWLVGIGLNAAIDWEAADEELGRRATCLSRESNDSVEVPIALLALLDRLQFWLQGWRDGQVDWVKAFNERCLLTGKVLRVRTAATQPVSGPADTVSTLVGRCQGIDSEGGLMLSTETGLVRLRGGEIVRWD